MTIKYYTGVGSRDLFIEIYPVLFAAAKFLSSEDYVLRSGGAEGADECCEAGCDEANGEKEIYVPWKNFNKNPSHLVGCCAKAAKMAEEIHPAWEKCSKWAKIMHGRNCYQVLGRNLDHPSSLLICFTPNGEVKGGTATAITLAEKHEIPIYNFGKHSDILRFEGDFGTTIYTEPKNTLMSGFDF